MTVLPFYGPDEREIVEEIRAWSAHALEKNNPYFNGLPPCPYAKKAWQDERVAIIFKYGGNQCLFSVLTEFNAGLDLVIIVDRNNPGTSEQFHDYLDGLNEAISRGIFGDRDLWVMGFHPEDGPNELIDDGTFEPQVDTSYAMIFVQRLSKVQEAADKLKQMGYYDAYLAEYDAAELYEKRETLYRRLKNGDEPA
jgi:hypothetical protein